MGLSFGGGVPKIICKHKSVIMERRQERTRHHQMALNLLSMWSDGSFFFSAAAPSLMLCALVSVHPSDDQTIHLSKVNVVGLILKPKPISITSGSPGQATDRTIIEWLMVEDEEQQQRHLKYHLLIVLSLGDLEEDYLYIQIRCSAPRDLHLIGYLLVISNIVIHLMNNFSAQSAVDS